MRQLLLVLAVAGCGSAEPPAHSPKQRGEDSAAAVTALQASHFEEAAHLAKTTLAADPKNSRAAAVHAIAMYQMAGSRIVSELGEIIDSAHKFSFFDHPGGRAAWKHFLEKLDVIDRDLAIVAADPSFSLELCIACWTHDWNHNGRIDERDRKLFELEFDGKGGSLEPGDPRRRPTFRFDVGDADWARATIAFQRAAGELVLAYKWSDLDNLLSPGDKRVVIKLTEPDRVKRARELIIAGLGYTDRCRAAYLAETDDDREWVPNPRQHDHPIPLAVDDELYVTWAGVTGDVRRMLNSEEGVSIRELSSLVDPWLHKRAPEGYIDLGRMLREPEDIVIEISGDMLTREHIEQLLRGMLGNGYQTSMPRSPLVGRLRRMKGQLDHGDDTFERKLRYLLWLY